MANSKMSREVDSFTGLVLEGVKETGEELGTGAYGRVFAVDCYGTVCAAKEIHPILVRGVTPEEALRTKDNFLRECRQCAGLRHPNVVKFVGVYYKPESDIPILVMEKMDESLRSLIERNPNLPLSVKLDILLDVSLGLMYLHYQKIVHRDLSSNNILLTSLLRAKISDLGVAKVIRKDSKKCLTKAPGTADFMPPESLIDMPVYDMSLDVFSYGGVVLHIATQDWPTPSAVKQFDPKTRKARALTEVERRQTYLDKMMTGDTKDLMPLAISCLDDDPNARPAIDAVSNEVNKLKDKALSASVILNPMSLLTEEKAEPSNSAVPSNLVVRHWSSNVVGLNSLGNTCLFNSMLQCVLQTTPLCDVLIRITSGTSYVIDSKTTNPILVNGATQPGYFMIAVQELFNQVRGVSSGVLSPRNVLIALSEFNDRFGHGTQEDCHKVMRCLLSAIRNDEILAIKAAIYTHYGVTSDSASHSILDGEEKLHIKDHLLNASKGAAAIDQLIGSTLLSTLVCRHCLTAIQIKEMCLDLSLAMAVEEDAGFIKRQPRVMRAKDRSRRKTKEHAKAAAASLPSANGIESDKLTEKTDCVKVIDKSSSTTGDILTSQLVSAEDNHPSDEDQKEYLNEYLDGHFDSNLLYIPSDGDPSSSEDEPDDEDVHVDTNVTKKQGEISKTDESLVSNPMVKNTDLLDDNQSDKMSDADSGDEDTAAQIALSSLELNYHLKAQGYPFYQYPLYNKHPDLTLENCLKDFINLDVLDDENKFICDECSYTCGPKAVERCVSKQVLIERLPPVLILQIKRFSIGLHSVTKDDRFVSFQRVLDMAPYCTTPCCEKLKDVNGKILYGLYGVVEHSGSLHGGHYTAYVRHRLVHDSQPTQSHATHPIYGSYDLRKVYDEKTAEDGQWYYTSDSHVSRCRFSEVQRCQAYLLFYEMLPIEHV